MKREKTVESYIQAHEQWAAELAALRAVMLKSDMTETIKWGAPCYVQAGQNVVGMMAFKNYFGLWFHQGVLLKDEAGVLVNAQEGKTRALRQWRMTSMDDLKADVVKAYVDAARDLAEAGKSVKPRMSKPLIVPPELQTAFETNADLRTAFDAASLTLRREYADYISEAKQNATKQRRLSKVIPMILSGEGLGDKYR